MYEPSRQAVAQAMYSDSTVDLATTSWREETQLIRLPNKYVQFPVKDRRVNLQVAQSESEYCSIGMQKLSFSYVGDSGLREMNLIKSSFDILV